MLPANPSLPPLGWSRVPKALPLRSATESRLQPPLQSPCFPQLQRSQARLCLLSQSSRKTFLSSAVLRKHCCASATQSLL
jgi:hypothetical protein